MDCSNERLYNDVQQTKTQDAVRGKIRQRRSLNNDKSKRHHVTALPGAAYSRARLVLREPGLVDLLSFVRVACVVDLLQTDRARRGFGSESALNFGRRLENQLTFSRANRASFFSCLAFRLVMIHEYVLMPTQRHTKR